ncbi:class I SAM-dependent methyltransferase [Corynebacterium gerontici]|uniref:23S rRNA (Guanine(745)-N(1))-methyltransferase n=1 Tax=Corynebacterium gerontici TaxID=2079234 RepID=A0A3G6IZV7_9CORY|nr:class I SAM-dependent methyltransferase [Corynebacterium gerontici]AZA11321.1 23S rRNA (guanine(745)-N(1))-methyltransferase [Corynebacterium gerontici]
MHNISADDASQANRRWWNSDADAYHEAHPEYLQSFFWCPEMLAEAEAHLLGDLKDKRVLEIGCGSGPCSSWIAETFPSATVIGFDISADMVRRSSGTFPALLADVHRIPLAANSMDVAFSAFGAFPFIPDLTVALREVARVLRSGGTLVIAANHPMRWIFEDFPDERGLIATNSYFEQHYVESDEHGELQYAEFQHTMADWINAFHAAGFSIEGMTEPTWPEDLTTTWGQWSPLRGKIFPGTVIFQARLSEQLPPSPHQHRLQPPGAQ